MSLNVGMITVDCVEPKPLAQWWADATGGAVVDLPGGEFVMVTREGSPALGFQRVETPTPGKNRVHLDFTASDMESEVQRLLALGATETGRYSVPGGFRWVVLADPEGNAFCVAEGPH